MDNLLSTVSMHLSQMNLVNLSTALHRLAKMTANDHECQARCRGHPVLEELLKALSSSFHNLGAGDAQPQSLSNVAWSLATLRLMSRPLLQEVASLAVGDMAAFKPFELSTMLWAFAKLGSMESGSWGAKGVFQAAASHIVKNMQHFGFRCLATTVWAFATAKQRHARLFRAVAAHMVPMAHAANCQEMANTAWAYGTADFHDAQLFHELAEQAMTRLEDFKPQELSNILWGFATNGFFHEVFYSAASRSVQRMSLQAQHLANIIWAYARVRPRHAVTHSTILALLPLCTSKLDTFKPQEVSSTALAVAKAFGQCDDMDGNPPTPVHAPSVPRGRVPHQVRDFFQATIPWAIPRLSEFSAQSLANTVSAFAMLPTGSENTVFAALSAEVLNRYDELEARSLLHLLKGFTAAPSSHGGNVVRVLAAGVARRMNDLSSQDCHTLTRICCSVLGSPVNKDATTEELRGLCLALAVGNGQTPAPRLNDEDMTSPSHGHSMPAWSLSGLVDAEAEIVGSSKMDGGPSMIEGFGNLPPPDPVNKPGPWKPLYPVADPRCSLGSGVPGFGGLAPPPSPSSPPHTYLGRSAARHEDEPDLRSSQEPQVHDGLGFSASHHHSGSLPSSYNPGGLLQPGFMDGSGMGGAAAASNAQPSDIWDSWGAATMKPGGPTPLCTISESKLVAPPAPHVPLEQGGTKNTPVDDIPRQAPAIAPTVAATSVAATSAPTAVPAVPPAAAVGYPPFALPEQVPPVNLPVAFTTPFDPRNPMVNQASVPYFHYQQQMAKRGYAHSEYQWRFSVKNSFFHVQYKDKDDSDDDKDSHSGSSQRSTSVPSRLDHDDIMGDWNRRRQYSIVEPRSMASSSESENANAPNERVVIAPLEALTVNSTRTVMMARGPLTALEVQAE